MKITTLAKRISEIEGKKVQVNIAQIKEILLCAQKILKAEGMDFYRLVKNTSLK